jgi:hypothetical protein
MKQPPAMLAAVLAACGLALGAAAGCGRKAPEPGGPPPEQVTPTPHGHADGGVAVPPAAPAASAPQKPTPSPAPVRAPAFFGDDIRANSIVFVVDRSSSMREGLDNVKWELARTIDALTRGQRFQVLFFSSGAPLELPGRRLIDATDDNKQRAREFLDAVLPSSGTDPLAAIRRAFALRPDVIYLLTDGEFEPPVVGLVKGLDPERRVRVNTIAFLQDEGAAVLKAIAAETGGTYRFVRQGDLTDINLPR